jgi:hypothetical protein
MFSFQRRLGQAHVPHICHLDYHKRVEFYIYFCRKYGYAGRAPDSAHCGG